MGESSRVFTSRPPGTPPFATEHRMLCRSPTELFLKKRLADAQATRRDLGAGEGGAVRSFSPSVPRR